MLDTGFAVSNELIELKTLSGKTADRLEAQGYHGLLTNETL